MYDKFISEVGEKIQKKAEEKLSPRSETSKFWEALIKEKGKVRPPDETYTDNVCQTLKNELEKGKSLNTFLEIQAVKDWEQLVIKLLSFFGDK
ncbi:hypothetical protein [Nostoc sp.]|uniref:hypothetical protein n=1 Tax=Nostoc sp. TaxID=1180 RepID=UPI002FF8C4F9